MVKSCVFKETSCYVQNGYIIGFWPKIITFKFLFKICLLGFSEVIHYDFKGNFYVYNGDIVGFRAQNPDIVY